MQQIKKNVVCRSTDRRNIIFAVTPTMCTRTRRHKYPKEYKCCNDTTIACGLLCCKRCDKYLEEDVLKTSEEEAENALIWEKTVDKTVKSINGNWSWASAGLLATACQAPISLGDRGADAVWGNWLYFSIIFIIGVVVAVAEHSFESPERIAKELEIKVPPKKAALGDKKAIKKQKQIIKKATTTAISNDRQNVLSRILRFVQIEVMRSVYFVFDFFKKTWFNHGVFGEHVQGNILWENLENLFIAIISNVVALSLNDAVSASFENAFEAVGVEGEGPLITAHWVFVAALTMLTCLATISLGKEMDRLDIRMLGVLEKNGVDASKKELLRHSTLKRVFKLIEFALGLVLAWALRDAMKMTIMSIYGESGSSDTVSALWTYTLMATALVTLNNAVNARYYLLYPREEFVAMQLETDERAMIGKVLYSNAQTVVGIAWYDALVESPEQLEEEERDEHRVWLLWVMSVSIMLFSGILGAYWERAKLRFNTKEKGPVIALFEAFDDWLDPEHVLDEGKRTKRGGGDESESEESADSDDDDDDDSKNKVDPLRGESFVYEYMTQFVDLMVFALGFASGWLVSAAVKATLIKSYEGIYDPDEVEQISDDVIWSVWVSFFIALAVSTLTMTYLSKLVQTVRRRKYEHFAKWRKELEELDEQIDKKLEVIAGQAADGRTGDATEDNEVQSASDSVGLDAEHHIEMQ